MIVFNNAKATMDNTQFVALERVHGFSFNPYPIVLNAALSIGIASVLMYDWVHCTICDGVADAGLGMFFKIIKYDHFNERSRV